MNDSPGLPSGFLQKLARHPVPVLLAICLFAWLPGLFALPPLDRDESRFAQASKQMIESGNYIDIRFSTVPRYNKPVGIYWAQSAATRALGHPPYNQIWTYRIPSLLGGILAVLLTYWSARAFTSRETALLSGALLALCVALSAEAEMATTDALLLATIVAGQGFLLRVYLHARRQAAALPPSTISLACWGAIGAGVLLKGPVILAVLGLTALALSMWDRSGSWLRGLRFGMGIPVMLAIVLPWMIAIAFASHGAFYQRSLGHDFAAKVLSGQETHGAPPGFYLLLFSVTFWPATLFALPAIGRTIAARAEPALRFLLCWAVPNWLMFEIVPTKLPHYILPVYPALAIMAGVWVTGLHSDSRSCWPRVLRIFANLQFAAVALLAAAVIVLAPMALGEHAGALAFVVATLLIASAGLALLFCLRGRFIAAAAPAVAAASLLYPLLGAGLGPNLDGLWMSRSIADRLHRYHQNTDPPVMLAGYVEPSLVFLLGTDTRLETGKVAGTDAARHGGLAIVEDRDRKGFLTSLHGAGGAERVVDQLSGLDYSRGRNEHVTIYRVAPARAQITPPAP